MTRACPSVSEVMQGWSKVAEDTGAMKSAFTALKDTSAAPAAPPPQSQNNKPEYTAAEKQAAVGKGEGDQGGRTGGDSSHSRTPAFFIIYFL